MKVLEFLNSIVTRCLAVIGLLFIGATLYEEMRQYKKKEKKAQKKSSEE